MASISSYSLFSPAWSSSSSNATSTPIPKLVPTWFPHPSTFLRLSYPTHLHTTDFLPDSQHYDKGWLDIAFVIGWTIIFAIVREISMRWVFAPFMRRWLDRASDKKRRSAVQKDGYASPAGNVSGNEDRFSSYGHNSKLQRRRKNGGGGASSPNAKKKPQNEFLAPPPQPTSKKARRDERAREKRITRFAEQGWSVLYYIVYFSFGMVIHTSSPSYPFNLKHLWIDYPENHIHLPGLVKFYYLTQLAFWFNQIAILHIEEARKDYYQMLSHHIITTCLMIASYLVNCTRVGCLILVLFDFCDILLPLAKMLKYMSIPVLPDITFGLFLVSWLFTRQIMFLGILLSVIYEAPVYMDLKWDPPRGAYVTSRGLMGFATLLGSLLVLTCTWFIMIVRVAVNVLRGKPAEDTRSDDEGEDDQ